MFDVKKSIGFFIVIAELFFASHSFAAAPATPIMVTGGQVLGAEGDGVRYWLGIPFAAPPVGQLRWREPQAVIPWAGIKKAQSFAPACAQNTTWVADPKSEDCLYLNIWSPKNANNLPVLVWIHDGGLFGGSASQPVHYGGGLAKHGAVVVTINYRLGIFGFFSHPELSRESPHQVSGNQGIQDQIAALNWVKQNIAAFGGNPANVTILGNSAGGESVAILVASPLAKGLFHRAIAQSGNDAIPMVAHESHNYDRQAAELKGINFAQALNAKSLSDLRGMTVAQLHSQQWLSRTMMDGYVLTEDLSSVYRNHRQNDVPLLVGWAADEGKDLSPEIVDSSDLHSSNFAAHAKAFLRVEPDAALLKAYPAKTDQESVASLDKLINDWWGWRMWYWADLQKRYGKSHAYVYLFAHYPAQPAPCNYSCGVGHGVEIPFIFDNLAYDQRPWTADDKQLAAQLAQAWVNFAKNGGPEAEDLRKWSAFDGTNQSIFKIGSKRHIEIYGKLPDFSLFEQIVKQ